MGRSKDSVKSTTIVLSISPDYVRHWNTLWEPIRELIQNALDADLDGFPMDVKYTTNSKGKGVLHIKNTGITMNRSNLLMGTTSKYGKDRAGQFGEGFKIAYLCLIRKNYGVWTKVGDERWVPRISPQKVFDGAESMEIDVHPTTYEKVIHVKVTGVSEADWSMISNRILSMNPPERIYKTHKGDILLDVRYKGKLYVRGLYVGELKDAMFGYNLTDLELDRDRRVPSSYDIQNQISDVFRNLLERNIITMEDLYKVLNTANTLECNTITNCLYDRDIADMFADYLFGVFGDDDVLPVDSIEKQVEAKHLGLKTMLVTSEVASFYSRSRKRKYDDVKSIIMTDTRKVYSLDELSEEEINNWDWVFSKVKGNLPAQMTFEIVDFYNNSLCGLYSSKSTNGSLSFKISIAHRLLLDVKELLTTVVHEVAHTHGKDGQVSHQNRICDLFADALIKDR